MALAYLMKDVGGRKFGPRLNLTAFVVDHQARPGSREEALRVSKWLQHLGMHT